MFLVDLARDQPGSTLANSSKYRLAFFIQTFDFINNCLNTCSEMFASMFLDSLHHEINTRSRKIDLRRNSKEQRASNLDVLQP